MTTEEVVALELINSGQRYAGSGGVHASARPTEPASRAGLGVDARRRLGVSPEPNTQPDQIADLGRAITEDDLRATIKANPWFGDWDEWAEEAYNRIPVFARMAMAHIYGRHDDTEIPYAYCVLCHAFRVHHNDGSGGGA